MNLLPRCLWIVVAGGLLIPTSPRLAAAAAVVPPGLDPYQVIWNAPGGDSAGSMPVGNGDVALNAWIEKNGDLVFYIGKNDAWSGEITSPGYGVYGLIKVGRVRVSFTPNPFSGEKPGFTQAVRMREGRFEAGAGTGDQRSELAVWVDANHPVIHVESKCAQAVRMKVTLESWRTAPTEWLAADTVFPGQKNRIVWSYRSANQDVPELLNRTIGAAVEGGGLVSTGPGTLESAAAQTVGHVAIHTLTAQCATQEDWLGKLEAQMAATNAVPLDQARRDHGQWWARFWDRSHVIVSGGEKAREVTAGYVGQRYLNACSSRGEFPIKFNGSLFVIESPSPVIFKDKAKVKPDVVLPVTADYRGWGHQYWFQNTRPMYWPMMASGDFDLMRPFFRMYRAMLDGNARQVQEFYGHDGAYFRETTPFWGGLVKLTAADRGYFTFHYYTPILEYSAMALDYFAYTGDRTFAKETLIPMADAGVTFFARHFKTDANGKLFISPANSAETFWKVNNPTTDVAGLHWVLSGLLALPADLTGPEKRRFWQSVLDQLPAVPVGDQSGKRLILSHESPKSGPHNSENPELYAVYPFRIYGLGKPDFELAKDTFAARRVKRAGCWSQDGIQAAFLGDTATAKAAVIRHLTNRDRRMRFPAFWSKGFDYPPDQDNGGNGLHALQSMLLQFDGARILVLPAWPRDWDADFKLHAPFQTTVSGTYKEGKLVRLEVDPPARRKDVVFPDGSTTWP